MIPKYFTWESTHYRCHLLSFTAGAKGTSFLLIDDNLQLELGIENELECTIWWHFVLMFPWKTLALPAWTDQSAYIQGKWRRKPCIHECCSSITIPHLKFRLLHTVVESTMNLAYLRHCCPPHGHSVSLSCQSRHIWKVSRWANSAIHPIRKKQPNHKCNFKIIGCHLNKIRLDYHQKWNYST